MIPPFPFFKKVSEGGSPIAALTAYDYPTARLLDEAGVDLILTGDSLGMVVLGYENTTHVTLADMVHHTKACRRGTQRAVLVSDLPYRTYDTAERALASAKQLMDAGADAVKLEGGKEIATQIEALVRDGIPVVGHLGMLPQHIIEEGGYKKKGKTELEAQRLLEDARELQRLGVFAIILESMLAKVGKLITHDISIPTIGIGAGPDCDGQILVVHDLIGAFPWFRPPFAISRAQVAEEISRATREYIADVKAAVQRKPDLR